MTRSLRKPFHQGLEGVSGTPLRRCVGNRTTIVRLLFGSLLLCTVTTVQAREDALTRSINTSVENNRQEEDTQKRIDALSDKTRALLEEYHIVSRELEALSVYNGHLARLVQSQENEKASIRKQMADMELTKREIVPLMLRMVEQLETLIEADQPFLPEERRMRVAHLRELMDRADISVGEKYRRVLDAYQIEMEYGRTIEAYRGELDTNGQARTVDFLRLGRVGLYYQTLDRRESGYWDASAKAWQVLPTRYTLPIRTGLRIARKQAAPDLLRLPVAAPREAAP